MPGPVRAVDRLAGTGERHRLHEVVRERGGAEAGIVGLLERGADRGVEPATARAVPQRRVERLADERVLERVAAARGGPA